ncbi:MAG: rhomboid family intramembrane serine protease [Bacteroidia bacterium]
MSIIDDLKYRFSQNNAITKIILVNAIVYLFFSLSYVFLFLFNASDWITGVKDYLKLPASFYNFIFRPWSIISYMFLHAGFFHILFNMLWLYWIGQLLQQFLGNTKTYQAYFLGGIFGGFVYMLAYNIFPAFSQWVSSSYAIGASAGVLSVVVATATLLPDYQIMLFILGAVRLKYIALATVLFDLLSIPNQNPGGHIAHLGGALFGYLFIKLIYNKNYNPTFLDNLFEGKYFNFKRKPKLKVHYKTTYMRVDTFEKPTQEEIDAILDKISKNGYNSLSSKEKEQLFKASKS